MGLKITIFLSLFLISCVDSPVIDKTNAVEPAANSQEAVKGEGEKDLDGATAPQPFSHTPKPESCEQCHQRPESGLRSYPNQGPPANFVAEADYPGSGHYKGKDCVQCHGTPEEGSEGFAFRHSTENPNACLPCHYNEGHGEHLNDMDVVFAEFGNCESCHQNFNVNETRNFDPINGEDD